MQRLFPTFGPAGCTFLVPALISPKVSAACAAHFFSRGFASLEVMTYYFIIFIL